MNEFETELIALANEFKDLQDAERNHTMKVEVTNGKLRDFLKKHNMPEQFTMPEIMQFAIRRSRA